MNASDSGRTSPPRRPPITPPTFTPLDSLPQLPDGYPLSYFAETEPFATWLRRTGGGGLIERRPSRKKPGTPKPAGPPPWTDDVRLVRFTSRRISRPTKKEPYTGKYDHPLRPFSGAYEYIVEFTTTREVALALPEPKGTVAVFGRDMKEGDSPARMRLRFIVLPPNGRLASVDISGDIRFRLPQGLVRPLDEENHQWVNSTTHTHVVVPLGNARLTLARGLRPRLSRQLLPPPLTVRIGATGLVVKLAVARIDITGTAAKPRIRFKRVRLVYLGG
jgi:hypothetical protein